MDIMVRSHDGAAFIFENATKWVIDESNMLHIVGENGNLASFAHSAWASVVKDTTT